MQWKTWRPGRLARTGVILAAGHGSRMGPFGDSLPKPIVPICNKPLLTYQIDYMRELGIREVYIVIGHLGHRISQVLGNGSQFGVMIHYVEQEERLGIAHAVGQLEPYIDKPFVLFLGDIFFDVPQIDRLVHEFERECLSGEGAPCCGVIAVKEESDPEAVKRNFSVLLREDGTVRRVIEKPRHVSNLLKGCGLYLFDLPIFDAIRRTPRTAMRDEYELTDSIQILIDYEYKVRIAPIVEWDMNLTYIKDLITCSAHQLKRLGRDSLIGTGCRLADGVRLVDSVVGDGVTIARPVTLTRCVVLSGVALNGGKDHKDTVFTGEAALIADEMPK